MKDTQQNLYSSEFEHDACGIGFVAHLKGIKSHQIVEDAIIMLQNMEHRGACGCEPDTGDGAGILVQKPHTFFQQELPDLNLPAFDDYGVAMIFFPLDDAKRAECIKLWEETVDHLGLELIGYRKVPTRNISLGRSAKLVEHHVDQAFLRFKDHSNTDPMALERRLFVLKNYVSHTIHKTIEDTEYISVRLRSVDCTE